MVACHKTNLHCSQCLAQYSSAHHKQSDFRLFARRFIWLIQQDTIDTLTHCLPVWKP
ncbi:hypothetical protein DPMN_032790 [Dreissena polymorpha]|uniref:Uncharacterized protein n=1 Tax=Dreissena polymorpha TaxID=45954 RepID=A0A9D4M7A5_DREPO|nr:hypothetical protein DPMN_032790 [Dreissena polymorpha]